MQVIPVPVTICYCMCPVWCVLNGTKGVAIMITPRTWLLGSTSHVDNQGTCTSHSTFTLIHICSKHHWAIPYLQLCPQGFLSPETHSVNDTALNHSFFHLTSKAVLACWFQSSTLAYISLSLCLWVISMGCVWMRCHVEAEAGDYTGPLARHTLL